MVELDLPVGFSINTPLSKITLQKNDNAILFMDYTKLHYSPMHLQNCCLTQNFIVKNINSLHGKSHFCLWKGQYASTKVVALSNIFDVGICNLLEPTRASCSLSDWPGMWRLNFSPFICTTKCNTWTLPIYMIHRVLSLAMTTGLSPSLLMWPFNS